MLGGIEIEIDEDGFIQEPDKWNKDVAEDLAKTENASPMNEEHWKLGQLSQGLLSKIWDRATRPDGGETDRNQSQRDL